MTRVYYKGAAACIIMFDLTSQQTFNSTLKWKKDLDSKCTLPNGKTIPCILVGNKVTMVKYVCDGIATCVQTMTSWLKKHSHDIFAVEKLLFIE